MRNKHLLNSILQNTSCPKGFWGRMILWGMNRLDVYKRQFFDIPVHRIDIQMFIWSLL